MKDSRYCDPGRDSDLFETLTESGGDWEAHH